MILSRSEASVLLWALSSLKGTLKSDPRFTILGKDGKAEVLRTLQRLKEKIDLQIDGPTFHGLQGKDHEQESKRD